MDIFGILMGVILVGFLWFPAEIGKIAGQIYKGFNKEIKKGE